MTAEKTYLDDMERALTLQLEAIRARRQALLVEEAERTEYETLPEMITIREACARTGLSRTSIKTMMDAGEVPYILAGTKALLNFGVLCALLRQKHG